MKVLELFAGSRSFSKVAEELGFETYATDINDFEGIDQVCDIMDFDLQKMLDEFGEPNVIWASPPCQAFSVASISHHWTGGKGAYVPKTDKAVLSKRWVAEAIGIIKFFEPVLRHASKGPTPVNANNIRPIGVII